VVRQAVTQAAGIRGQGTSIAAITALAAIIWWVKRKGRVKWVNA